MKKILFLTLMVMVFTMNATAQTAIANDYENNETVNNGNNGKSDSSEESVAPVNFNFFAFDGFQEYGISAYFINPNGVGVDFGGRINNFKSHESNLNIDFGPNYSFLIWHKDNMRLLLTAAAGPSFGTRDEINDEGNWHNKFKVDFFGTGRFSFLVGKFHISAGYFYWSPEWKFKGNGSAFTASIGYDF